MLLVIAMYPNVSVQKVAKNLEQDSQEGAQIYIGFRSYPWKRNSRVSGNKIFLKRERENKEKDSEEPMKETEEVIKSNSKI